jgi:ketosteroid isomerase-like protein
MRSATRLTAYLALVVAVGCSTAASESAVAEFTPADSSAIRASADKWVTTLLAKDFDGWGTTVSSDVVLYPPNSKPVTGRDAAIAFTKAYPPIEQFAINVDELTGIGDVAYDRGTYTTQVKLPNGIVMSDTGSFFSVFRRQPDGGWQHSRVMWTSHAPLPTPPAPPARRAR